MKLYVPRYVIVVLMALAVISVVTAVAAGISVPNKRLTDQRSGITANALKPAECASLNLTTIVVCPATGGSCAGTDANDLILGSALFDDIGGGKGDDCIVAGGGLDLGIRGDAGTDVCIGGPGLDTFHPSCETQIQ